VFNCGLSIFNKRILLLLLPGIEPTTQLPIPILTAPNIG